MVSVFFLKYNIFLTQLTTRSKGVIIGQSFGSNTISFAWISPPCAQYIVSWRPLSSFSLWIILLPPSLSPFIFPLINHCDRCLVPLAWGLMAGGHWFASHGGITMSRGWLYHMWKPLDILATHLH